MLTRLTYPRARFLPVFSKPACWGVLLGWMCVWLAAVTPASAAPAVAINEIHYHPVELPAFTNGLPVLDLSRDVHEFVELYNYGPSNVSLAGWNLSGDISFDFATNAALGSGQYLVVARNPARLAAITQYTNLAPTNLAGPYQGNLGNNSGSIRLRDSLGEFAALRDRERGFFAEHPLARLQRHQRHRHVPVVRRGDHHHVDVGPREDLAKIRDLRAALAAVFLVDRLAAALPAAQIGRAHV